MLRWRARMVGDDALVSSGLLVPSLVALMLPRPAGLASLLAALEGEEARGLRQVRCIGSFGPSLQSYEKPLEEALLRPDWLSWGM